MFIVHDESCRLYRTASFIAGGLRLFSFSSITYLSNCRTISASRYAWCYHTWSNYSISTKTPLVWDVFILAQVHFWFPWEIWSTEPFSSLYLWMCVVSNDLVKRNMITYLIKTIIVKKNDGNKSWTKPEFLEEF